MDHIMTLICITFIIRDKTTEFILFQICPMWFGGSTVSLISFQRPYTFNLDRLQYINLLIVIIDIHICPVVVPT